MRRIREIESGFVRALSYLGGGQEAPTVAEDVGTSVTANDSEVDPQRTNLNAKQRPEQLLEDEA